LRIEYIASGRLRRVSLALILLLTSNLTGISEAAKLSSPSNFQVVDVQSLSAQQPHDSIRHGRVDKPTDIIDCDLLIVGGGIGGVAAALRATDDSWNKHGNHKNIKVCLTEETDWIGGQMTAQGVSALDENYMVELSGATRSYQQFRTAIRDHYRRNYSITPEAAADPAFNPGSCWVSWLGFEPKVALDKLYASLKPAIDRGQLAIYTRQKPIYVRLKTGETIFADDKRQRFMANPAEVVAVGMLELTTSAVYEFRPKVCLDATELGDMLPLCGLNYSTGSDSRKDTGEPHSPQNGNPENVQDFTYPFVVEFREKENHTIAKPEHYDQFNAGGKFSFQGYKMFLPADKPGSQHTHDSAAGDHDQYLPFWEYRRLLARKNFTDRAVPRDLAMINWDSNDLRGENIIDQNCQTEAERLALGKWVSLGFLYWLQTEAPRDDGGKGYPELLLRTDVLGTKDGLSMFPYIRESRRVQARQTIGETDIAAATNGGARAKLFDDSVGIGLYPIDIHGMQEVKGAAQAAKPFQIPLGALIPEQKTNVLPACKNIGTTHITNGAYRLHPIEWAIGEAQGTLCRLLITHVLDWHSLFEPQSLRHLQRILVENGVPVYWYDDVATNDPDFAAIQFLAISGILPGDKDNLHFRPNEAISRAEAAAALTKVLPRAAHASATPEDSVQWCEQHHLLQASDDPRSNAPTVLLPSDFHKMAHRLNADLPIPEADNVKRRQFARMIYATAVKELNAARK
jgi:hypothetical protein